MKQEKIPWNGQPVKLTGRALYLVDQAVERITAARRRSGDLESRVSRSEAIRIMARQFLDRDRSIMEK